MTRVSDHLPALARTIPIAAVVLTVAMGGGCRCSGPQGGATPDPMPRLPHVELGASRTQPGTVWAVEITDREILIRPDVELGRLRPTAPWPTSPVTRIDASGLEDLTPTLRGALDAGRADLVFAAAESLPFARVTPVLSATVRVSGRGFLVESDGEVRVVELGSLSKTSVCFFAMVYEDAANLPIFWEYALLLEATLHRDGLWIDSFRSGAADVRSVGPGCERGGDGVAVAFPEGRIDASAVAACATKLEAKPPSPTRGACVNLRVQPDVSIGQLVPVIAAFRAWAAHPNVVVGPTRRADRGAGDSGTSP